jgi:hypothetical protein
LSSDRKIKANRANARRSTGPKTALGRARAARNALRHGLSLPVESDPVLSEEMETLARKIAGIDADVEIHQLARGIAEGWIALRRARFARHQYLSDVLSDPYYESRADTRAKVTLLCTILRHEVDDLSKIDFQRLGIPASEEFDFNLEDFITSTPEGPEKLSLILSQEARKLARFDRYERRARWRLRSGIRALDEATLLRLYQK